MSDEQTIYISPEDDLTTVRERLENISSRRVTLVIPSHTQLRSHVAWKLLYARSRELGKEVLIVSSDPQVRSVAHAVKFKVAHSLESNPQGRSRPVARTTRSANGRGKLPGGRAPKNTTRSTNSLRSRQPEPEEEQWYSPTPEKSGATSPRREEPEYRIEDVDGDEITDVSISRRRGRAEQAQPFDYRIDPPSTRSPIRPVPPEQIEEEADMLTEDYEQAQNIRQAASGGQGQLEQSDVPSTPSISSRVSPIDRKGGTRGIQRVPFLDDQFVHEEDSQPASAREQRGYATIEDGGTQEHEIQDVADMPTSVLDVEAPTSLGDEIEYHADNDDYLPPTPEAGTQGSWNRPETPKEEDTSLGRRTPNAQPGRGRSGYLMPPAEGRRGEKHAPVEDYSTQINPRPFVEPQTSSVSRTGKEPDPVQLPPPTRGPRSGDLRNTAARSPRSGDLRNTSARSPRSGDLRNAPASGPRSGDLRQGSARPRTGDLRSRGAGQVAPAPKAQPVETGAAATRTSGRTTTHARPPIRTARARRGNILLIAAIVVVLLALALLVYAVPTARVTLTVAGHSYAHTVDLTANLNNQAGALPARPMIQEFQKKGSEPATGSKLVGTAKSKGFVCFTNKNDASIEIPTGSIVSTENGVQFATTADGVVLGHNTCVNDPLTFPIEAAKPGETGNVLAGSVTVIPDSSLDAIAKYNKVITSSLKLSVNNSDDVKGGGMQPVPAVTDKDLANAKTDLSNQLKGEIDSWVQNLGKDGITGNVTTDATLVDAPPKDTILDSATTFPTQVIVKATVLFVANSDLQRATINQLNDAISKDKNYSGYVIAQDARPPVTISQLKKQADANSIKLNFNAVAQAIPLIPKETIQSLVSGKTPDTARKLLLSNIRGTQDANIQVMPGFFPWVSWWHAHIDVTILPGSNSNGPPTHS